MLKSSLWDYGDVYILVKETITVPNTAAAAAAIFKNIKYLKILLLLLIA